MKTCDFLKRLGSMALLMGFTACSQIQRRPTQRVQAPATVEVTRIVTDTPLPVQLTSAAPARIGPLTGVYRWTGIAEGSGCVLNVAHGLADRPFDAIDFELNCNRGAPSYNMGYQRGAMAEENNIAVFTHYDKPSGETCNLVFQFSPDKVEVTQIGTDYACSFGHGVYAQGIYERVDSRLPQLGCLEPPESPCQ